MALENRDLKAGQKLVARYKGQEHTVLVLAGDKDGLAFELDGRTTYKSLSTAGNAVTGGSVNGWRFWSLEGAAKTEKPKAVRAAATTSPKARTVLQIKRRPKQGDCPEGEVAWFCSGCMKSFCTATGTTPEACPEGHPRSVEDEFAATS